MSAKSTNPQVLDLGGMGAVRNAAIKALIKYTTLKEEFEDLLGIKGSSDDRVSEVKDNANNRMRVASMIVELLERKSNSNDAQLTQIKKQEKELYDELFGLPELGATAYEWEHEYTEEMKKRPLGRPGFTIEIRLTKAQNEYNSALANLRAMEKAQGVSPLDIYAAAKEKSSQTARKGRPKLDDLGIIDRKIAALQKRKEQLEQEEKSVTLSKKGVVMGRKAVPSEVKIDKIDEEIAALKSMLAKKEASLSKTELKDRKVKRLRDDARKYKIQANAASGEEREELLSMYKALRAEAESLAPTAVTQKAKKVAKKTAKKAVNVEALSETKQAPKAKEVVELVPMPVEVAVDTKMMESSRPVSSESQAPRIERVNVSLDASIEDLIAYKDQLLKKVQLIAEIAELEKQVTEAVKSGIGTHTN